MHTTWLVDYILSNTMAQCEEKTELYIVIQW